MRSVVSHLSSLRAQQRELEHVIHGENTSQPQPTPGFQGEGSRTGLGSRPGREEFPAGRRKERAVVDWSIFLEEGEGAEVRPSCVFLCPTAHGRFDLASSRHSFRTRKASFRPGRRKTQEDAT